MASPKFQIIRGGRVLNIRDHRAEPADILIAGDDIREIGPPGLPAPPEARAIDAAGKLLMPGLVNAHTHGHGSLGKGKGASAADIDGASDPFSMFSELNGRGRWRAGPGAEAKTETRKVFNAERKALQVMGLGPDATLEDVKIKYKALVKQHHPDANGGDRSTEDRLIEIIKAYNYLKTVVRAG